MKKQIWLVWTVTFLLIGGVAMAKSPAKNKVKRQLTGNFHFLGAKVPDRWFIKDKLQKWLLRFQAQNHQETVCQWLRRESVYGDLVREQFGNNGIPKDFLYVMINESGLKHSALSKAGAYGPCQFMPQTAREYGLRVNGAVDERGVLGKCLNASAKYLQDRRREFGDWPLSAVAYNAGPRGVREAIIRNNGTRNAWLIDFPTSETDNYLAKALVIREIMEHPEEYGFPRSKCIYINAPPLQQLSVMLEDSRSLRAIARHYKIELTEFMALNPAYGKREKLPAGSYHFILPTNVALQPVD